jgi:hypothetical protein
MAAICKIPGQITTWESRGMLAEIILPHFEIAFTRPLIANYGSTMHYQLGMIIGQMIFFQWIPEERIRNVCEIACGVFALDDPIDQPTSVCGALNIIIAGFFAGLGDAIFGAVPDFCDRCLAFMKAGGMFGNHNKFLIGRWLAAASDDSWVLILREAYNTAQDLKPNEKFDEDMKKMEKFVGFNEKQSVTKQ